MKNQILFFTLVVSLYATCNSSLLAASRSDSLDSAAKNPVDFVRPSVKREPRNPRPALRTVDGAATKGPIVNASISVYEIDDTGMPVGSAVATSTSDSSGAFSVSLPASAFGMLMVKTAGGSFVDESDTRPPAQRRRIALGSDEGFRSIILNSQSTVAVTPYTDALIERALGSSRLGGFKTTMQRYLDASTTGFGFSIFETLPADPAAPSSTAGSDARQYALLLGAAANIANVTSLKMGMAAPTFDVLKAMVRDFSDGRTDGLIFGEEIRVNGKIFPDTDFDQQLTRFRNNNFASYAGTSRPEWDSAAEDLAGDFPPGEYYTYTIREIPVIWGLRISADAKLRLRSDGTGKLLLPSGSGEFLWGENDGILTIDFSAFGGFIEETFSFDSFSDTTYIDQLVITRGTDGSFDIAAIGRDVIEDNGNVTVVPFEDPPENVLVKNRRELYEFPEDPDQFEGTPAFPVLTNGEPPIFSDEFFNTVDGMIFNSDGTGTTTFLGKAFTWQLTDERRALKVEFANGESATYYILLLDDQDPEDFVVADYVTSEGHVFLNSQTVLSNIEELVWTADKAIGYLKGEHSLEGENDEQIPYERSLHNYPNGTGAIEEIHFFDVLTGQHVYGRTGYCWDIDQDGFFNVRYGVQGDFDQGFVPTPAQCSALSQDAGNVWRFELYDDPPGELRTVIAESVPEIDEQYIGIYPTILQQAAGFTAQPPVPVDDVHSIQGTDSLTIDPLENDIVNLPLDRGSVEITSGPLNLNTSRPAGDSVSVNPETGAVTVTPDSSDSSFRDIEMNYRVKDTSGNVSIQGRIFVTIDPGGSSLPPLSNLSGIYSGSYFWNCGSSDLTGSTTMTLDISNEEGSSDVFGTVTLFNTSTSIHGSRLDLPMVGLFGFEGGTLDPEGHYVHLFYSEVDNVFTHNELSLEITEAGLSGVARNGDSDVDGGNGCALSGGAAGTVELTRQSSPSPRFKPVYHAPSFADIPEN